MKSKYFLHLLVQALTFAAIAFSLAVSAQAQTQTVLYNFVPGWTGNYPDGTILTDGSGNLFGSAQFGGNCCGVVYELSQAAGGGWTYKVLTSFGNDIRPDRGSPSR